METQSSQESTSRGPAMTSTPLQSSAGATGGRSAMEIDAQLKEIRRQEGVKKASNLEQLNKSLGIKPASLVTAKPSANLAAEVNAKWDAYMAKNKK